MRQFVSTKHRSGGMTALAAAVAFVVAISAASAAEREKPRKKVIKDTRQSERIYSQPDENGWYPRDARLLKFGSRIWWDQMEREGRLGPRDW